MVNSEVRKKLLAMLGISKQALSQRARGFKVKYGPMTTDEAVYVIAHMEGIDLSKDLPLAMQDRIRSLVPRGVVVPSPKKAPTPRKRKIAPAKSRLQSYPLVDSKIIETAHTLGREVFPQVFILENSIRALVKDKLSPLGTDWWEKSVPTDVQNNVKRTMKKESKFPYRKARGDEPLLYANFNDLKLIICTNPNGLFNDVLIKPDWFTAGMDDVYMARNNLAHSIPLVDTDIEHIHVFVREWAILVESVMKGTSKKAAP